MRSRTQGSITKDESKRVTLTATNHSDQTWWPPLTADGSQTAPLEPGATRVIWNSGIYPVYNGRTSNMVDYTGPDLAYRDVSHQQTDWDGSATHTFAESRRASTPNRFGTPCDVSLLMQGTVSGDFWCNQKLANMNSIFPKTNEQMAAYARGKLDWGSIEPHIDLPRSIAELKDFAGVFKNLYKTLKRIGTTFKGVPLSKVLDTVQFNIRREGRNIKAKLPNGPGQFLDAGISADLTWKFAVKPLIEDIKRCMELSAKAEKLIETLSKTHRYAVRGRETVTTTTTDTSVALYGQQDSYLENRGTHTCVAWVLLETRAADASFIDALRVVAGLNLRWRTAWELVPLSFVVDWFVKVGDQISYWDIGTGYQRPFEIVASGISHKKEYVGRCKVSVLPWAASQLGAAWIPKPVGNSTVKNVRYDRTGVSILPSDVTLPPPIKFSLPNLGQTFTMLELIKTMTKR